MAQLITLKATSTDGNVLNNIQASFPDSVSLKRGSTIFLKSLYGTLAEVPPVIDVTVPTNQTIIYTATTSLGAVTATLNVPDAIYAIEGLLNTISNLFANSVNNGNPNNPEALVPNAEYWYGLDQRARFFGSKSIIESYFYPTGDANFSNWIVSEGGFSSVSDTGFTRDLALGGNFSITGGEEGLPVQAWEVEFTLGTCDEFIMQFVSLGGEFTIYHNGDGNMMQFQFAAESPLDVANATAGDVINVAKIGNRIGVSIGPTEYVRVIRDIDTEQEDAWGITIEQDPGLQMTLADMTYNNISQTGINVDMNITFTDPLYNLLGYSKSTYAYNGNPATLIAENQPKGVGNYDGVEIVISEIPLLSYQGEYGKVRRKNVLAVVNGIENNVVRYVEVAPQPFATNLGSDIELSNITLTAYKNGQTLKFIDEAYAQIVIRNPRSRT